MKTPRRSWNHVLIAGILILSLAPSSRAQTAHMPGHTPGERAQLATAEQAHAAACSNLATLREVAQAPHTADDEAELRRAVESAEREAALRGVALHALQIELEARARRRVQRLLQTQPAPGGGRQSVTLPALGSSDDTRLATVAPVVFGHGSLALRDCFVRTFDQRDRASQLSQALLARWALLTSQAADTADPQHRAALLGQAAEIEQLLAVPASRAGAAGVRTAVGARPGSAMEQVALLTQITLRYGRTLHRQLDAHAALAREQARRAGASPPSIEAAAFRARIEATTRFLERRDPALAARWKAHVARWQPAFHWRVRALRIPRLAHGRTGARTGRTRRHALVLPQAARPRMWRSGGTGGRESAGPSRATAAPCAPPVSPQGRPARRGSQAPYTRPLSRPSAVRPQIQLPDRAR